MHAHELPKAPWRAVVRRKRTLGGSVWLYLDCTHAALRRGAAANEYPEKVRCKTCAERIDAEIAAKDVT